MENEQTKNNNEQTGREKIPKAEVLALCAVLKIELVFNLGGPEAA